MIKSQWGNELTCEINASLNEAAIRYMARHGLGFSALCGLHAESADKSCNKDAEFDFTFPDHSDPDRTIAMCTAHAAVWMSGLKDRERIFNNTLSSAQATLLYTPLAEAIARHDLKTKCIVCREPGIPIATTSIIPSDKGTSVLVGFLKTEAHSFKKHWELLDEHDTLGSYHVVEHGDLVRGECVGPGQPPALFPGDASETLYYSQGSSAHSYYHPNCMSYDKGYEHSVNYRGYLEMMKKLHGVA